MQHREYLSLLINLIHPYWRDLFKKEILLTPKPLNRNLRVKEQGIQVKWDIFWLYFIGVF